MADPVEAAPKDSALQEPEVMADPFQPAPQQCADIAVSAVVGDQLESMEQRELWRRSEIEACNAELDRGVVMDLDSDEGETKPGDMVAAEQPVRSLVAEPAQPKPVSCNMCLDIAAVRANPDILRELILQSVMVAPVQPIPSRPCGAALPGTTMPNNEMVEPVQPASNEAGAGEVTMAEKVEPVQAVSTEAGEVTMPKVEKVEPVQAVSNKAVSDVEMVEPDQPASTSQVSHEKGQPSIHGASAAPRLARPMTSTPLEPPEEPANGKSLSPAKVVSPLDQLGLVAARIISLIFNCHFGRSANQYTLLNRLNSMYIVWGTYLAGYWELTCLEVATH